MHIRWLLIALLFLGTSLSHAQGLNPNGIYFNGFSGGFPGSELFQVMPTAKENTFIMADLFGGGFLVEVNTSGEITLLDATGPIIGFVGETSGSFSNANAFTLDTVLIGSDFVFESTRIPFTNTTFPLELESPVTSGSSIDGTWTTQVLELDPQNGLVLSATSDVTELALNGDTLTLTNNVDGFSFQAIFESGNQAISRIIGEPNLDPDSSTFLPFPGITSTGDEDLLAEINFLDQNSFEAILIFQTRAELGAQEQRLVRMIGHRTVPLLTGDANADGIVNADDVISIEASQGLSIDNDGYNLSADLNNDGFINSIDISIANGATFVLGPSLGGAWANLDTLGQGFSFDFTVSATATIMAASWLTFDTELSTEPETAAFGTAQARWFVGAGNFNGNSASLGLTFASGGAFNNTEQTDIIPAGNMTVTFSDCNNAIVDFEFTDGPSDTFPITRITPNAFCINP